MSEQSSASAALPEIPGYRIERRLGEGGMAEVYLGVQLSLERQVAIKVLSSERAVSEDDSVRFEREARTVAKLDHPSIVGIFDVGRTAAGQPYYAMPYLPRGDLSNRKLTGDEIAIVAAISAICDALGYAHAHGIVHRDVKPENILFDRRGHARLADFGIALSREHSLRVTGPNKTLGSSGYMSPEQARGQPLDGRSDLYSLGVVCYELLTGELPYMGADALAVALGHANDPVPRLKSGLRHWQAFIDRALAKEPDQRFQSALEMRDALVSVKPQPITEEHPAVPARRRIWIGAAVVLVALAGLVLARQYGRPKTEPAAAAGGAPDLSQVSAPDAEPAAEAPPIPPAALAVVDTHALDQAFTDAFAQLKRGRLFEPEGDNASERFLALLASVPQSAEARAGLDAVLDKAAARAEKAIAGGDGKHAAILYDQSNAVAERSGIRDYPAWVDFERRFAAAASAALDDAAAHLDPTPLAALAPALDEAQMHHPEIVAKRERLAGLPKPGAHLADRNGPLLAFVPAHYQGDTVGQSFALGVTEVSRGDYLAFADATKRAPAKCRDGAALVALFRHRDVRDPGFPQEPQHPAVCVSHDDAVAYAQWLSQHTGQRYRLPTAAEWLHAARGAGEGAAACALGNVADQAAAGGTRHDCNDGVRFTAPGGKFRASPLGLYDLVGNAAEWTADCSGQGGDTTCQALGASFRDGPKKPLLGAEAHSADTPTPDLGFRLLRELSFDTLPPPAK